MEIKINNRLVKELFFPFPGFFYNLFFTFLHGKLLTAE